MKLIKASNTLLLINIFSAQSTPSSSSASTTSDPQCTNSCDGYFDYLCYFECARQKIFNWDNFIDYTGLSQYPSIFSHSTTPPVSQLTPTHTGRSPLVFETPFTPVLISGPTPTASYTYKYLYPSSQHHTGSNTKLHTSSKSIQPFKLNPSFTNIHGSLSSIETTSTSIETDSVSDSTTSATSTDQSNSSSPTATSTTSETSSKTTTTTTTTKNTISVSSSIRMIASTSLITIISLVLISL